MKSRAALDALRRFYDAVECAGNVLGVRGVAARAIDMGQVEKNSEEITALMLCRCWCATEWRI